jgi:hypothetical protein
MASICFDDPDKVEFSRIAHVQYAIVIVLREAATRAEFQTEKV